LYSFFVSLIEFASVCFEDENANRAHESLKVFNEVVNSPSFVNVPILLILNKVDLLPEVMSRYSFSQVFPNYTGLDDNCADVILFLKDQFIACYKKEEKNKIFPMLTSLLDPKLMKECFETMLDVTVRGKKEEFKFKMHDPGRAKRKPTLPLLMSELLVVFSDVVIHFEESVTKY
jgi:hypothetical protein